MNNPYGNLQVLDKAKRPATANYNPARRANSVALTKSPGEVLSSYRLAESTYNPLSTQDHNQTRPQTQLQNPRTGSVTLSQLKQEIDDIHLANYYKNLPMNEIDYQRQIRFGSKMDTVEEVARLMRQQVFDHAKFNVFLDSVFGRTLLKGLLEANVDPKSNVSNFIRENNTYSKATREARKETMANKRETLKFGNGRRNLPSTTKISKQIEAFILKAKNESSTKVLADKFKEEINATESTHKHKELVRMKSRVKEEMRRHSQLTTSSRVNQTNLTIDQLIRLLEFNQTDLSVDAEEDERRHQNMMDAMLFLFRAINIQDWQDISMENMDEKMKVLKKLKKEDFKNYNHFNSPHDIPALKQEQKVLKLLDKQNANKTHLQLLIEKKHAGQQSLFGLIKSNFTQKKLSENNSQNTSPLLRNKNQLNKQSSDSGSKSRTSSITTRDNQPSGLSFRNQNLSKLSNNNGKQIQNIEKREELNILEDDDDGILSSAFLTPHKVKSSNQFENVPHFYQSAKTQKNTAQSNKKEVCEFTQSLNKFKFRQNLYKNRLKSAQKVSIIPELKKQNQKQSKTKEPIATVVTTENTSETSQIVRRKTISQRAKMASDYIVSNCLSATKQDENNDRLIQGCYQISDYQGRLKDAIDSVTEKNLVNDKQFQLTDIKGELKAINHEESMYYNHFFCPFETNQFKESNRKITHYLSGITKHQKREIWKPSKFQVGRFTTVGIMLHQA